MPLRKAAFLAGASAIFLALAAAAMAQAPSTATQTVDAMNKLWGRHAGARANHAKGVVVLGSFTPSREAATLSKANIFAGGTVPVTVRFSDSTGLPDIADGAPKASPHGMAIQFHPLGGATVDVVTNSLGFFPVATGEDFRDLLTALSVSGPNAAKPTAADSFIAAHPSVPKAFATVATPASFAEETYNGVDAFVFVNASGKRQPFRFKIVPAAGTHHLTEAQSAKMAPDFLVDELPVRLAAAKIRFHLLAQLARPGDPTNDATKPWPSDRKLADMGTLTLDKAVPDNEAAQKQFHVLPNVLAPGIEVSDDPLINARVRAYVISFGRRAQ
jgi:catalase